jgi:hypothetical protein
MAAPRLRIIGAGLWPRRNAKPDLTSLKWFDFSRRRDFRETILPNLQ